MEVPLSDVLRTTSDISNSFNGSGLFLLEAIVFSKPGRRVVRTTCQWITPHKLVRISCTSRIVPGTQCFWDYRYAQRGCHLYFLATYLLCRLSSTVENKKGIKCTKWICIYILTKAKVNTSVKPAAQMPFLSWSESLLIASYIYKVV